MRDRLRLPVLLGGIVFGILAGCESVQAVYPAGEKPSKPAPNYAPSEDRGPRPGPNYQWHSGHWEWNGIQQDWVWRSGRWRVKA